MTKLISWNVNSLRIRLDGLRQIVEREKPDVICLQEVKAKPEDFPFEAVRALGFEHIALYGMPGYNGVAIAARRPLSDIRRYDWAGKADARHISAVTADRIEVHNIYIPAGGDLPDPEKILPLPVNWRLSKNWNNISAAAPRRCRIAVWSPAVILTSPLRKTTSGIINSC